jgi:hypothetical protein
LALGGGHFAGGYVTYLAAQRQCFYVRHNTMRQLLLLFSLLIFSNSFGQTTDKNAVFKIEEFTNVYSKHKVSSQKIKIDSVLDLKFYREHFYIPYYFPSPTIDKNYTDTTVIVWIDTSAVKDYKSNWTHTYKYDSNSRVTEYTFSGCFICSNLPYTITLTYDILNRVIQLDKYYGLEIPKADKTLIKELSMQPKPSETYKVYYDNKNNIIRLDYFLNEVLNKRVTKT